MGNVRFFKDIIKSAIEIDEAKKIKTTTPNINGMESYYAIERPVVNAVVEEESKEEVAEISKPIEEPKKEFANIWDKPIEHEVPSILSGMPISNTVKVEESKEEFKVPAWKDPEPERKTPTAVIESMAKPVEEKPVEDLFGKLSEANLNPETTTAKVIEVTEDRINKIDDTMKMKETEIAELRKRIEAEEEAKRKLVEEKAKVVQEANTKLASAIKIDEAQKKIEELTKMKNELAKEVGPIESKEENIVQFTDIDKFEGFSKSA